MPDRPRPESPLIRFEHTPRSDADDAGADVPIYERPFLDHVNLRGDGTDPAFVEAVEPVLGTPLPLTPNRWRSFGDLRVFWLGPEEWLLITQAGEGSAMADDLRQATDGLHAAITVISGGQTVIGIEGPQAADLLSRGCTVDLHPRAFGEGCCAQTLVAKAPALIWRLPDDRGFELAIRRSFAEYLWLWLSTQWKNVSAANARRQPRLPSAAGLGGAPAKEREVASAL
jgi:sarcosine oxidase, subunit gamma